MQRVPSPDGQWVAVVYATGCGSTTTTVVDVSILPASETKLPGTGNVFRADADRGRARVTKEGYPWAEVSWTGPTEILIRYDDRALVAKQETKRGNVVVRYAIER